MEYSKDGPFTDPVVRCDSCRRLLLAETLRKEGCCKCGMRKIRNVASFDEDELEKMKKWGVDPDFLKLFEAVDDE